MSVVDILASMEDAKFIVSSREAENINGANFLAFRRSVARRVHQV